MSTIKTSAFKSTLTPRAKTWITGAAATGAGLLIVVLGMTLTSGGIPDGPSTLAFRPHLPDIPLFLRQPTVIQVHLLAALGAVALGGVLMSMRKGVRLHRIAGWTWVGLMAVTAISSLFITSLNGDKWSLIHLLAGWTIISLPFAVIAARRHQVQKHRKAMMGMFYGGVLIAGALAFIPGRLMWRLVLG